MIHLKRKKAKLLQSKLKWAFFALALIILGSCTKLPTKQGKVSAVATASNPQSPYTMSAEAYLALAKNQNQNETEQQNLLLLAAGRYIEDAQFQAANHILTQVNHLAEPIARDEKNILLARINMAHQQPQAAISRLAAVRQVNALPQYFQILYHSLLASAYDKEGNLAFAVNEQITLDHLLSDPIRQTMNRRNLWLNLTRLPLAELNTMGEEADNNPDLEGWIKLALIARQGDPANVNQTGVIAQIEQWQQHYAQHPANSILPPSLSAASSLLQAKTPQKIALLLPLTGSLAGPGNAIRDGFIAAYTEAGAPGNIDIQSYDTNAVDIAALYQKAIANGADYVVGPLTKPEVMKVAKLEHPVPTIFLNDTEVNLRDNAYRFGLSPTNEARQVADRAHKMGLHRALIIAPTGSWGDDIVSAFSSQWRANGGELVERLSFDDKTDLNVAIREFLHVSEWQANQKQYHSGRGPEKTHAKRRDDFDMIFLLAYPSSARQIMPMLRYYFAGNVPVYSTSAVYSGNTNTIADKDLDGIIFCDMPWVFSHQLPSKNWPESLNSYSRLYAMGMDSYALATDLNRLILFPAMSVNNNTGVLYLNKTHQIGRVLSWGQFKEGVAQLTSQT